MSKYYETASYTWCKRDIKLESGEALEGRIFVWRGDPMSKS
jgi:hypothetical protein